MPNDNKGTTPKVVNKSEPLDLKAFGITLDKSAMSSGRGGGDDVCPAIRNLVYNTAFKGDDGKIKYLTAPAIRDIVVDKLGYEVETATITQQRRTGRLWYEGKLEKQPANAKIGQAFKDWMSDKMEAVKQERAIA